MTESRLRAAPSTTRRGVTVFEVWYGERLLATITPDDKEPGVRIISKYQMSYLHTVSNPPQVLEVKFGEERR